MKSIAQRTLALLALALVGITAAAGPVDINTADATTLAQELNGVGRATAQAIVAYREVHGRFTSAEALLEVKGVGPKVLERNRDNILVKQPDH